MLDSIPSLKIASFSVNSTDIKSMICTCPYLSRILWRQIILKCYVKFLNRLYYMSTLLKSVKNEPKFIKPKRNLKWFRQNDKLKNYSCLSYSGRLKILFYVAIFSVHYDFKKQFHWQLVYCSTSLLQLNTKTFVSNFLGRILGRRSHW